MRLFVTGGTGFIGGHFLRASLAAGHEVIALRRKGSTPRIRLKTEPTWIDGDLESDCSSVLRGCDALVHLAAVGTIPRQANWRDCLHWNVAASAALWERAADAGVQKFVIGGSCFEYGRSAERFEFIHAQAPLEPLGSYHASKAAATMAAWGLAIERSLSLVILRPFHVFGDGEESSRFWPSLRAAAYAGSDFPMTAGDQVRDFVPVEQVASEFLASLSRPLPIGQPEARNIGTGRPKTLRRFAEEWWENFGATGKLQFGALPYRTNEVMRYVPQI